jgi:hypothetical protein
VQLLDRDLEACNDLAFLTHLRFDDVLVRQ